MQKSLRKRIAKEIVIFVSSVLLIIFSCTCLWAFNTLNINNKRNLTIQLSKTEEQINTVYSANSIELGKKIKENFSEYVDHSDEKVGMSMNENYPNYFEVYADYLETKNLLSDHTTDSFYQDLRDSTNAHQFYEYIRDSNLKAPKSFSAFLTIINHQLLPPALPKDLADKEKELKTKIEKQNARIYTKQELYNAAKWVTAIIFFLVYPIRFVSIAVIWSVRELTDKTSN